jgi:predicted nucleic acid-binding protein
MGDTRDWVKVRYLDASALVKLYVDEEHSLRVRAFVDRHPQPFQTTSLCFAEALNVFKRKWLKETLTLDQYLYAVHRLTVDAWGNAIQVEDFGTADPFLHQELARLAGVYHIDVGDALQLLTILKGNYSRLVGESRSVLITADRGLAVAADGEGVRVWNVAESEPPTWA